MDKLPDFDAVSSHIDAVDKIVNEEPGSYDNPETVTVPKWMLSRAAKLALVALGATHVPDEMSEHIKPAAQAWLVGMLRRARGYDGAQEWFDHTLTIKNDGGKPDRVRLREEAAGKYWRVPANMTIPTLHRDLPHLIAMLCSLGPKHVEFAHRIELARQGGRHWYPSFQEWLRVGDQAYEKGEAERLAWLP